MNERDWDKGAAPQPDDHSADLLQAEYMDWRRRQGLEPTVRDIMRLARWLQWAGRWGEMFAPWMYDL